ncbi:hypothetical protein ACRAWB_11725 [Leifsonia poae]|uniref:hypothetical protein n=1 Tax=Leifsonia poae TaxID=110933 RepID=UPI003D6987DA
MDEEVLAYLNGRTGADEAAKVTTYRVYIHNREVAVEVYDHGPQAGDLRYSAAAYLADLPEVDRHTASRGFSLGNPEPRLRDALSNVHWWEFDNLTD